MYVQCSPLNNCCSRMRCPSIHSWRYSSSPHAMIMCRKGKGCRIVRGILKLVGISVFVGYCWLLITTSPLTHCKPSLTSMSRHEPPPSMLVNWHCGKKTYPQHFDSWHLGVTSRCLLCLVPIESILISPPLRERPSCCPGSNVWNKRYRPISSHSRPSR